MLSTSHFVLETVATYMVLLKIRHLLAYAGLQFGVVPVHGTAALARFKLSIIEEVAIFPFPAAETKQVLCGLCPCSSSHSNSMGQVRFQPSALIYGALHWSCYSLALVYTKQSTVKSYQLRKRSSSPELRLKSAKRTRLTYLDLTVQKTNENRSH